MATGRSKSDIGEHATKGGNKRDFGEHATKGGNKRDFGEHATKSGYKRDFGWKQPFHLPIPQVLIRTHVCHFHSSCAGRQPFRGRYAAHTKR